MNKVFDINFDGESYKIAAPSAAEAKEYFFKTQEVRETEFTIHDTMREIPESEWDSIEFKQEDRLAGLPDTDIITVAQYMKKFGNQTGLVCTTFVA